MNNLCNVTIRWQSKWLLAYLRHLLLARHTSLLMRYFHVISKHWTAAARKSLERLQARKQAGPIQQAGNPVALQNVQLTAVIFPFWPSLLHSYQTWRQAEHQVPCRSDACLGNSTLGWWMGQWPRLWRQNKVWHWHCIDIRMAWKKTSDLIGDRMTRTPCWTCAYLRHCMLGWWVGQ